MISHVFNVRIIFHNHFFVCQLCRRNVLGVTRFAHWKKSKESELFVSFLPRLVVKPGLVLNFSATALRNSVVSGACVAILCERYLNSWAFKVPEYFYSLNSHTCVIRAF